MRPSEPWPIMRPDRSAIDVHKVADGCRTVRATISRKGVGVRNRFSVGLAGGRLAVWLGYGWVSTGNAMTKAALLRRPWRTSKGCRVTPPGMGSKGTPDH